MRVRRHVSVLTAVLVLNFRLQTAFTEGIQTLSYYLPHLKHSSSAAVLPLDQRILCLPGPTEPWLAVQSGHRSRVESLGHEKVMTADPRSLYTGFQSFPAYQPGWARFYAVQAGAMSLKPEHKGSFRCLSLMCEDVRCIYQYHDSKSSTQCVSISSYMSSRVCESVICSTLKGSILEGSEQAEHCEPQSL